MSVSESEKECPLCMEALDWDDLGFFPCSCGYQICRFCWHRLRTDENGLCPACRQAFPDIPVSFNPEISAEELKKQKKRNREKRSNKDQVFKPQDLATLRVVQKNLVFVIGLSSRLTQEDLKKEFAHFGKIIKFVHNKSTAYITYSKPEEAIRAIRTLNASAANESAAQHLHFQSQLTNGSTAPSLVATNNVVMNTNGVGGSLSNTNLLFNAMSAPAPPNRLKASLGTTKYCNHFLRSQQCPKVGECMYLHEIADADASFTKEQMQAGKHVEYEKKLMDSYLAKMEQSVANPQTRLLQLQQQQQQQLQPQQFIHSNHQSQPLQQPIPSQPQLQRPQQQQPPPTTLTQIQLPLSQLQSQPQSHQQLLLPQQRLAQQQHSPQSQQQSHLQHLSQQQTRSFLEQQQQHQQAAPQSPKQLVIDTDSEDDGLDFDPISVSTSGLRDLLDQQVQQAKQQLQMQNYLQQVNSTNQTLASVLFQQNNRLNHPTTATTNGLIGEATFNGHPQALPFAGLNNSTSETQQVSWQNLSAWATFLQRSGYGFENSR